MPTTPTPLPVTTLGTTASPQVELSYSEKDHQFTVKATNVSKVSYTLLYNSKNQTIEQALAGGGKGDAKNTYSASHLAGTESSGTKVYHHVVGGTLEATIEDVNKKTSKIIKTFTVSEKGVLTAQDVGTTSLASTNGEVQGASTDNPLDTPLAEESVGTDARPTPVASTLPIATPQAMVATPTQSSPSMPKILPFLGFVALVIAIVALIGAYLQRRSQQQL